MPGQDGLNQEGLAACKEAFASSIATLNQKLISNLAIANTEEEKQGFIEDFKKGVELSKEVRKICDEAFK